jgi:hypothetical protein
VIGHHLIYITDSNVLYITDSNVLYITDSNVLGNVQAPKDKSGLTCRLTQVIHQGQARPLVQMNLDYHVKI